MTGTRPPTSAELRPAAELLSQLRYAGWSDVIPGQLVDDLEAADAADTPPSATTPRTRPSLITARVLVIGAEPDVTRDAAETLQTASVGAGRPGATSVARMEIQRRTVSGTATEGAVLRELLRDAHLAVLAVGYEALVTPSGRDRQAFAKLRPWFDAVVRYCGLDRTVLAVISPARPASSQRNRDDWVWRQIRRELRPGPAWTMAAVVGIDALPAAGPEFADHPDAAAGGRWHKPGLDRLRDRLLGPVAADPAAWLRASVAQRLRAACDDLYRLGSDILMQRATAAELDADRVTDPDYAAVRQTWLVADAIVPYVDRVRTALNAAASEAGAAGRGPQRRAQPGSAPATAD